MADAKVFISRQRVQTMLDVDAEFLQQLEEEEIVVAHASGYQPQEIERIRICRTLHHELHVNWAGLDVALRLLETIEAQRRQFAEVLTELNRHKAKREG